MRLRLTTVVSIMFVVLAFLAVSARQSRAAAPADEGKATLTVTVADATAGSAKLKEADYDIRADGSNATFSYSGGGGVAAKVPIQWKDEPSKATSSSLDYDGSKITAVHFKGKTRYAEISQ